VSVEEEMRRRVGQALSDALADRTEATDWCDSREIDALVDAVMPVVERDIEDGRMFRWIAENATVNWDLQYKNAVVCFPVDAEFFDTVEDAVRKAMAPHDKDGS